MPSTTDLGRVVPLLQGEYAATATYELNDVVTYNYSTYWHHSSVQTTGVLPTNTDYWSIITDASQAAAAATAAQTAQGLAEGYAGTAGTAKTGAETAQKNAEAWAVGQRNGVDVASGDAAYHNNAKYYAQQAGNAQSAAEDAQGYAEDAQTAAEAAQADAEESAALVAGAIYVTDRDDSDKRYTYALSVQNGALHIALTEYEEE